MVAKEQRDRTHVKIPVRLKRRIKEIAIDKNMAMNDIIVEVMNQTNATNALADKVNDISDKMQ